MNKLVGYTVLVLGTLSILLIYGLVNDGMKDIVFEKNGLQFENLSMNEASNPKNEPFYFVSQKDKELTFYSFPGHWSTERKIDLSVFKTNDTTENLQSLSVKAVNEQLDYSEYIRDLDQRDMVDLISKIEKFQGMKLSQYSFEKGWFGYIDDTPIIFVLFGFILFILCLIFNSILSVLERYFGSTVRWLIPGLLIMVRYSVIGGYGFHTHRRLILSGK